MSDTELNTNRKLRLEVESLRQRVQELEVARVVTDAEAWLRQYVIGLQNVPAQTKDELKQSQGEPVAWEACCPGPIYAREVFKTKAEAESCSDAWDSCFITPLYTSAPTIPEGWQLVPIEPTKEMLTAAGPMENYDFHANGASPDADHVEWYKAMLAAAPKPEGKNG